MGDRVTPAAKETLDAAILGAFDTGDLPTESLNEDENKGRAMALLGAWAGKRFDVLIRDGKIVRTEHGLRKGCT